MIVWREIAIGKVWDRVADRRADQSVCRLPIYSFTRGLLSGAATDLSERMALSVIILLLALIGGRVIPELYARFLERARHGSTASVLFPFRWHGDSSCRHCCYRLDRSTTGHGDGLAPGSGRIGSSDSSVALVRLGHLAGTVGAHPASGIWMAGHVAAHPGRRDSWVGIAAEDAVHALTTGAVGVMTLAIMTRASLGHTGRPRHAGPMTVMIYILVNLGAVLRVFGPATPLSTPLVLSLSAMAWGGAYLLFALVYGPFLLRPSLDEE